MALVSQPLSAPNTFNWVLLLELIICGILSIFFLGYLDRLFATVISYAIRAYTWRSFHAYIDIQALQLSLLGGRIFFKDLRYHAHNETIVIHSGYITWNYWVRKVRDAQIFTENGKAGTRKNSENSSGTRSTSLGRAESGGGPPTKTLPCRVTIHLEGVQAFLYNRSPVYDAIIEHISKATEPDESSAPVNEEPEASTSSFDLVKTATCAFSKLESRFKKSKKQDATPADEFTGDDRDKHMAAKNVSYEKPKIPSWLQLFPIQVRCKTAAAVLGNENTRSIITLKVDSASGTFDAGHAGPLDVYKLLFEFSFEHPVIRMRPNLDFKELQLTTAVTLKKEGLHAPDRKAAEKAAKKEANKGSWTPFSFGKKNSSTDSVRATTLAGGSKEVPLNMPSAVPGQERWQGLTRYMDDDLNDGHDEWDAVEYGKSSTIADCPEIGMTFYWDIPGPVPESKDSMEKKFDAHDGDINGSSPPEYGLDLRIHGGNIVYGPWADRQRVNFQSIFFPGACADTIPVPKVLPGEPRVSTIFKLFLSVEDEMTLRIPVREPSKDPEWKGRADIVTGKKTDSTDGRKSKGRGKRKSFWPWRDKGAHPANVRPFAWLDIKLSADSTVSYSMDMVARPRGYQSDVSVEIRGLEISTSINHGLLWRSGVTTVACDTSVPLGWNALREWKFDIVNDDLELYILRDHLFLITDVIADWGAGPLPEYFTFTPFRYLLNVVFRNFKLFLNTNNNNIIDDPADRDKNEFVILFGSELRGDVIIPLETFRPVRNEIFFDVTVQDLGLQLLLSPRNAVAAFLGPKTILQLDEVTLNGSHAYYSQTSSELTDRLTFKIHGSKMKLFLFGFVIDRLMTLKENYFGEDLRFNTYDEFKKQALSKKTLAPEADAKAQQMNRSNELDVILIISAEDIRAMIPANLYSTEESVTVQVPYASADLRLNSYYMDLQVDFSPMTVAHSITIEANRKFHTSTSRTEIFIESATLYGHRVFGLAPLEPPYLCIWDVGIGDVSGECSSTFVEILSRAIQCLAFSIDDDENNMRQETPLVIPDMTYLRVRTSVVKLWVHVEADALLISLAPITLDFNDRATEQYSMCVKAFAPEVMVSCVNANSASRHRTRSGDQERRQRGLAPSSVAFSSPLTAPYFPLQNVEPDDSELPPISSRFMHAPKGNVQGFTNFPEVDRDDNTVYMSLVVALEPGIQCFVKPQSISAVANLVDRLLPKTPETLLDFIQSSVMKRILELGKRTRGIGQSIEASLRIPTVAIRFVNDFTVGTQEENLQPTVDQYDLDISRLALVGRHTAPPAKTLGDGISPQRGNPLTTDALHDVSLLHCTVDSIAVAVKERPRFSGPVELGIRVQINDILLWIALASKNSVNLTFKDLEIATAGKRLESLAAVVHRSVHLVNIHAARFATLLANTNERLRYLIFYLVTTGEAIPDPPFLLATGLRIDDQPDHLRHQDSWKIISRLRHIYRGLPKDARQNLDSSCRQNHALCPGNAKSLVINSFERWPTLEFRDIKRSYVIQDLYGGPPTGPLSRNGGPLKVSVRSSIIRIVIDPGPKESYLTVDLLSFNLASSPPSTPSGLMLSSQGEVPREDTLVEVSSKAVSLSVHWEIIDLVETAISLTGNGATLQAIDPDPNRSLSDLEKNGFWRDIQAVVAVGDAVLQIMTPNVNASAAAKRLRTSLIVTDKSSSGDGLFSSALLHAATARTEFHSHNKLLLKLESQSPNLYVSRSTPGKTSADGEEWRVAGTCANVFVQSAEELLSVIETVDLFVQHEVSTLKDKFMKEKLATTHTGPILASPTAQLIPKVTVALLMDAYRIQIALLPKLKYSLSGTVGRVSVTPDLHQLLSLAVDLDINSHVHELISHDHTGDHIISAFEMPPINAHVKLLQTSERIDISVTCIIESIVLEASSIHGLLSTFSQPEVSSTIRAVSADFETLKQDIDQAFPPSNAQTPALETSVEQKVAYDVSFTLAGIQIKADAPGKLPDAGNARLFVGINCLQLNACNLTPDKNHVLPIPEVHAQLRQFFIELRISDQKGTRSCGNLTLSAAAHVTLKNMQHDQAKRQYKANVDGIIVNLFAETASAVVDVLNHLQDRIKDIDFSRERKYLERLRQPSRKPSSFLKESIYSETSASSGLFTSAFQVALRGIQISWIVGNSVPAFSGYESEDLVLAVGMIDLSSVSESSSRLSILGVQLQTVPVSQVDKTRRSLNSALMPEMVFNVGYTSTEQERRMTFTAKGNSLEVLLDSRFMLPVNLLQRSIGLAFDRFREATASWEMAPTATGAQRKNPFGDKRLSSLLVDADFAGAKIHLQGRGRTARGSYRSTSSTNESHQGRYGQFSGQDSDGGATLTTPGLALKVEYKDTGHDSSLSAELNVSGSSNTLTPTLVPLILEISDSVKTIVAESDKTVVKTETKESKPQAPLIDQELLTTDPSKLLGGTTFNLGIRICRQEFSLSCQPIARVAASAHVGDIYIIANSVKAGEHDHFISVAANLENIQASIQHIYSRESTFSFDVQSIALTMMNSKHLSGTAGLSAALRIYPMKTQINTRQLQDFLLFREIWVPPEIRGSNAPPADNAAEPQDYLVARYQQATSAAAFPWTATVSIAELRIDLDMGQAIGKSTLLIDDLWASSRKDLNWEQNLCVGVGKVGIDSTGRMSGFVELSGLRVRTMIAWPQHSDGYRQTPSIQASAGFERLRLKAAFDYMAFAVADISSFDFLMYNVRPDNPLEKDRLVTLLDGDKVNVFLTAHSASQCMGLYQAFERLIEENQKAYEQSLKDIEKFLRHQSAIVPTRFGPKVLEEFEKKHKEKDETMLMAPISLYTDVVVTLKSINIGAFPSAFFDNQIFLIEASDVQARFAATLDKGRIHSGLGMTLGQLQVALTSVAKPTGPKTLQEITIDDVVNNATNGRGGTILRVPKVIASMQTWQTPASYQIDYIFKSEFLGKVDVGWNYSRISFIRNMYETHARSLASRLGKPLPESAVKITTRQPGHSSDPPTSASGTLDPSCSAPLTAEPEAELEKEEQREKITAVVNVPQSKYSYTPLEPPIIETPQLRDMGEATPPLEWIGLHRERLPNVTHQIVIVALLGVAKEVEDAYGRILGNT
ncbi:fermentation associated protein [Venturia nashicola]|nr:fermentation associated protein [Venturia nashicola]